MAEECVDVRREYCGRFAEGPRRRSCVHKTIQQICCRTCADYHPEARKSKQRPKRPPRPLAKSDL